MTVFPAVHILILNIILGIRVTDINANYVHKNTLIIIIFLPEGCYFSEI